MHRALRAAAGPDYTLMTDPVAEYSLEEAIRVGRDLERMSYHWYEEPFRDFELQKYAWLCVALAGNAVDIVRADVSWKAGVTGTLKTMKDPYPIDHAGVAHVPQKPGVGVELDWDAIDRACVEHRVTQAPE